MKNWMRSLSAHYEQCREQFPDDELLLLFDIDGTILDTRYTILKLLKSFDINKGTHYFADLTISSITFDEEKLDFFLQDRGLDETAIQQISKWYEQHRWSSWAIMEGNKPFPGVLEVIRWFQLQEHTHVGINTNRSEAVRKQTLDSLNTLGQEYRITFSDELLFMNQDCSAYSSQQARIQGIEKAQAHGFRIIAAIDNESENLQAIREQDLAQNILLLHASSFYHYDRSKIAAGIVNGKVYDLTELIPRRAIPQHIQFVWQSVNNEASLNKFLNSNIQWADLSDLVEAAIYQRKLRMEGQTNASSEKIEALLDNYIQTLIQHGRSIRVGLNHEFSDIECILDKFNDLKDHENRLWFTAPIDCLGKSGFRYMAEVFPHAILECPVDYLESIIKTTPSSARHLLEMYSDWGINRFALSWKTSGVKRVAEAIEGWGYDVTLCDIRNLENFLQAVLLLPTAVVSHFNFPSWKDIAGKDVLTEQAS